MLKKRLYIILIIILFLGFATGAGAWMGSKNFHSATSVISGGGTGMSSSNFKTTSTLGQSSPLMDQNNPPYSENYDFYPGFWYTLEARFIEPCEGDFDSDGDVDGSDLAVFVADFGRTDCCEPDAPPCEGDFNHDCDVDGSDLSVFAIDFGRTDCPIGK